MHYCFLTLKFRKRDPDELEVTADNRRDPDELEVTADNKRDPDELEVTADNKPCFHYQPLTDL